MKKYPILVTISLFLWSCTEDVSKDINTDLTLESAQLFEFSKALGESSYLGNLSYGEYLTLSASDLPGCPTIVPIPNSKIIELVYLASSECEQLNKTPRSGTITLDFTLASDTPTPRWTISYDLYTFNGIKIDGLRQFEGIQPDQTRENFEELTIELDNNLNFVASGSLTYSLERQDSISISLSTEGRVEGINPAGRDFSILINDAKEQSFECYRQGWILPAKGRESWTVSRRAPSSLDYEVNYQSGEECEPVVVSTLPDGRTFQLNP